MNYKKQIILVLISLVLIIYIFYIKFIITTPFLSYENYHGIAFLNDLSQINVPYFSKIKYFIESMYLGDVANDGNSNRIIYYLILKLFNTDVWDIFTIQSILSVFSYLFFSLSVFYLINNKKIAIILFLLLLASPNQIKYGFSEDYYIFGNFFMSLSLLFYVLFLNKYKIIHLVFFIISYIIAIYSRTLFLLYIPILIISLIYKNDFNNIITKVKNNIFNIIIITILLIILSFFVFDRYVILSTQNTHFTIFNDYKYTGFSILFIFIYILNEVEKYIFPYFYSFFIYVGIMGFSLFSLKNKNYKELLLLLILFIYNAFLLNKYIRVGIDLQRHLLLLEPIFSFFIALGIYSTYKLITYIICNKGKNARINKFIFIIILIVILSTPFYNLSYINKYYTVQNELIFIKNSISSIEGKYNLILPNSKYKNTSYEFPFFLLKNNSFDLYLYNISDNEENRYDTFDINKNNNVSIFYLSSVCYTITDDSEKSKSDKNLRYDCQKIIEEYNLIPIVEKKIKAETYIIPEFYNNLDYITIGFYKILGKK